MSEFAPIPVSLSSALETRVSTIEAQRLACDICHTSLRATRRILTEPNTVQESPLSWILCRKCYHAVLAELVYSPVQTAMRLRIAVGVIASHYAASSSAAEVRGVVKSLPAVLASLLFLGVSAHLFLLLLLSVWAR